MPIETAIVPGQGDFAFEAPGLVNPVRFGRTAESLVTIDTVAGPLVFGLQGATLSEPVLEDGVVRYAQVFTGVDLEFRTDDGRLGKHFVLADAKARQDFRLTIHDPEHTLGEPSRDEGGAWQFENWVAYGTGLELPAPAAWTQTGDRVVGLPGSAHQEVTVTSTGYEVRLELDRAWADEAEFPVVLDPAVEWY
ncbi:MAG: hypothetical protein GX593_09490, partial [Actinomycetales bacterium]|nr:hypothetical protein [Actinomycetales bacterium]